MPAHSRSWGVEGGLSPRAFSISLRDNTSHRQTPSPFRGEAIFFCVGAYAWGFVLGDYLPDLRGFGLLRGF